MVVKRTKLSDVPPSRFQDSSLYETREWKEAVREIQQGLKPNEAIKIRLEPETIASLGLKNAPKAFYVALGRFVERHGYPVDVIARATEDGSPGPDTWVIGKQQRRG